MILIYNLTGASYDPDFFLLALRAGLGGPSEYLERGRKVKKRSPKPAFRGGYKRLPQ